MRKRSSERVWRGKRSGGFTIVELLIVIVVIGVLAALTLVTYNGVINRTKGAQIAFSFRQVEKAFIAWHLQQGWSTWQTEDILGSNTSRGFPTQNTQLDWLLADYPMLTNYLKMADLPARNIGQLRYDNDGDVAADPCTASSGVGVNVQLANAKPYFSEVDKVIDNGDGQCGKLAACDGASTCVIYRLGKSVDDIALD